MRLVNCRYGQLQESIHSFRAKTDWRHRLVPKTVHKSNLYKIFVILLWHWLTGMQGILIAISDVHTKTWNLTMNDNNSYDHMWHVGNLVLIWWHERDTGRDRRVSQRLYLGAIACAGDTPLSVVCRDTRYQGIGQPTQSPCTFRSYRCSISTTIQTKTFRGASLNNKREFLRWPTSQYGSLVHKNRKYSHIRKKARNLACMWVWQK